MGKHILGFGHQVLMARGKEERRRRRTGVADKVGTSMPLMTA